jgi:hypothetical protein
LSDPTLPNGKRPQFDKDNPPPAALQLEIDEFYFGRYKKDIAKLFRSGSRASINGLTLRLISCFSAKGHHMAFDVDTTAQLVELAQRQKQFVSRQLVEIRTKLISLLDTPLSVSNSMTLQRHIMSRAPENARTKCIFYNVDFSWSQPTVCLCTAVKTFQNVADTALDNLIPEARHTYGPAAGKWFTSQALSMYEHIKWDPTNRSATTQTNTDTSKILEEDLWGLSATWKALPPATREGQEKAVTNMSAVGLAIDRMNITSARDNASFGSLYARNKDDDTIVSHATKVPALPSNDKDTTIIFDPAALPSKQGIPQDTDSMAMSTAAKTTESTRLRLRETKDILADTRAQLAQQSLLLSQFFAVLPPHLHQKFKALLAQEVADDSTPEDARPPPDPDSIANAKTFDDFGV